MVEALGESDDLSAETVSVAGARRAPATKRDALAGTETVGEGADGARHRAVESEIVAKIGFVSGDDAGAFGVVAVIAKDMRIAEDGVCPVDIDDGFSGAWQEAATALGDDPDIVG